MVRMHVHVTEEQRVCLQKLAPCGGFPSASWYGGESRRCSEGEPPGTVCARAPAVSGRFRSGRGDGARRHAAYLAEAFVAREGSVEQ